MTDLHPVQTVDHKGGKISASVTRQAYEVYRHVYGGYQTLERLNERGGFSTSELIAFLYARAFPMTEWRQRVDEAFCGMEHI